MASTHAVCEERGEEHPWNISVSAGAIDYEGDEAVEDSLLTSLHVGYDYSESWSIEGVLGLAPRLDEDFRTDWSTGEKISRLEETAGPGVNDTYAVGLALDGLFHFTRWERLDPYLSAGAGAVWYADDVGSDFDPSLRVGGGVMYHLTDAWALRADYRTMLTGTDTEANSTITAGIAWTLGAHIPPQAAEAPVDSDADGLSDTEETEKYRTDPHKRDTDGGGVADGHEVAEDHTNPAEPSDDLQMFELKIVFDEGEWSIKPEYFSELDAIGKVLKKDPGAMALIEGHTDKQADSSARRSEKVTGKRAKAILKYLAENWQIARGRMEAAGYGFNKPKAPNDPVKGNPENRRIEIYIRPPR